MVEMTNDKSFVDDNNDAISWEGRSQTRRHQNRHGMEWNEILFKPNGRTKATRTNQGDEQKKKKKKIIETFGEVIVFCSPATMHNTLYKDCATQTKTMILFLVLARNEKWERE